MYWEICRETNSTSDDSEGWNNNTKHIMLIQIVMSFPIRKGKAITTHQTGQKMVCLCDVHHQMCFSPIFCLWTVTVSVSCTISGCKGNSRNSRWTPRTSHKKRVETLYHLPGKTIEIFISLPSYLPTSHVFDVFASPLLGAHSTHST